MSGVVDGGGEHRRRTFVHRIVTRYAECDGQGVVFNAHYLTYCDDALDWWMRTALGADWKSIGWEFVLRRVELEWESPARAAEELVITVAVVRWGRTSFDVSFRGSVGDRGIYAAHHSYVGVATGTHEPITPPEVVRAALGAGPA